MFNKVHKPSTKLTILYLSELHYNINSMEYPGSGGFRSYFYYPDLFSRKGYVYN